MDIDMTTAQILNIAGLFSGMVGVFLIFVYGPPQPSFDEGVAIGLEDGNILANGLTVAEQNTAVRKLRRKYSSMSKLGLAFVFLGFLLQLIATLN